MLKFGLEDLGSNYAYTSIPLSDIYFSSNFCGRSLNCFVGNKAWHLQNVDTYEASIYTEALEGGQVEH